MNTKGKDRIQSAQREIYKQLQSHANHGSASHLFNIPIKPSIRKNEFQINIAQKKYALENRLNNVGLARNRQYSSSFLQVNQKPNTHTNRTINDYQDHSRDKIVDQLEQKYMAALHQVNQIKSERIINDYGQKYNVNQHANKPTLNNQTRMNTELPKKKTTKYIDRNQVSGYSKQNAIVSRSPLRPRTPDHLENRNQRMLQRTPDTHLKRMNLYMPTNNNYITKSPGRNILLVTDQTQRNESHQQQYNHNTQIITQTKTYVQTNSNNNPNKKVSSRSHRTSQTSINPNKENKNYNTNEYMNSKPNQNQPTSYSKRKKQPTSSITKIEPKRNYNPKRHSSALASTHLNTHDQQRHDYSTIYPNDQSFSKHAIPPSQTNKIKKDSIKLCKPSETVTKKPTVQSTYVLPEEKQIDFNELDQFSPPYVGQFNLYNNDRLTSPVISTTYTTIEMSNQDKQKGGTIASSSQNTNNKQIIDNFIGQINTSKKKYSTIEYKNITNNFEFKRIHAVDFQGNNYDYK